MPKLVFVHITKTAGTAIKTAIREQKLPIRIITKHQPGPVKANEISFVVLRDPVDRFASAVRYALQKYSHLPHIKALIKHGITTPEAFVQGILRKDPIVLDEFLNQDINFMGQKTARKIVYVQQARWVKHRRPNVFLAFEELNRDWVKFLKSQGLPARSLPKKNTTRKAHGPPDFSPSSLKWIRKAYAADYALIKEVFKK